MTDNAKLFAQAEHDWLLFCKTSIPVADSQCLYRGIEVEKVGSIIAYLRILMLARRAKPDQPSYLRPTMEQLTCELIQCAVSITLYRQQSRVDI